MAKELTREQKLAILIDAPNELIKKGAIKVRQCSDPAEEFRMDILAQKMINDFKPLPSAFLISHPIK